MKVFLILSLLAASIAHPDSKCSEPSEWRSTLDHSDVEGCPEGSKFCVLVKGTSAGITLQFTPSSDITSLRAQVHGVLGELVVLYKIPESDACVNSGLSCPLKAGQQYTYKTGMPVEMHYPSIKLKVKWELVEDDGTVVMCKIIPVQIKNP